MCKCVHKAPAFTLASRIFAVAGAGQSCSLGCGQKLEKGCFLVRSHTWLQSDLSTAATSSYSDHVRMVINASTAMTSSRLEKTRGSCYTCIGFQCTFVYPFAQTYRFVGYVSIPDRLSISIALGKRASNLKLVHKVAECVVTCLERKVMD